MEVKTPKGRKQKNKRNQKNSNKKKIKYPRQDIVIFFDDDANKQLTPYEIDLLKNITLEEEDRINLFNHPFDEGDIIFTDNAFPKALNKSDRKKLKRQMERESLGEDTSAPNTPNKTAKQKSTPKTKSKKAGNLLFSKFIKAQDPISQLEPTEENEFEIIYYNNGIVKTSEQEEIKVSIESVNEIEKGIENLCIDVISNETPEIVKEETTIDIVVNTTPESINEESIIDVIINDTTKSIDEGTTEDITCKDETPSEIVVEDSLFKTEHIKFKDFFVKALEQSKLNNQQDNDISEKDEIIFDSTESPNEIEHGTSSDEMAYEEFVIFGEHSDCMSDSDEEIVDEMSENDYDNYVNEEYDIFEDEEDNLLYEFYLEHGCDSFSDDSDFFKDELSLTDEDEDSEEIEEKHRRILRGSFNDEFKFNKHQSNNSKASNDTPRSNGSRKKKLSKREKKALRRDKRKDRYDRKDLFRLNMDFRKFISNSMIGDSKPIAQATKAQRRQLIQLASVYGLEITTIGPKSSTILGIKYCKSTKLIDIKESKKHIRRMMQNPDLKSEKLKLSSSKKFQLDNKYVGEHSSPIASDNVGHMILKKIGWSGGGLGANEQGNMDPIKVLIKKNKKGLGY